VPAVHVTTSEFEPLARSMARMRGYPNLPIIVLPHPFETRTDEEVLRIAEERFAEFERFLTDPDPAKDLAPAAGAGRSAPARSEGRTETT
jgi:hypothetical protein